MKRVTRGPLWAAYPSLSCQNGNNPALFSRFVKNVHRFLTGLRGFKPVGPAHLANSETGIGGGIYRVVYPTTHTGRHIPGWYTLLHTQGGLYPGGIPYYTHTGRHIPRVVYLSMHTGRHIPRVVYLSSKALGSLSVLLFFSSKALGSLLGQLFSFFKALGSFSGQLFFFFRFSGASRDSYSLPLGSREPLGTVSLFPLGSREPLWVSFYPFVGESGT